MPLECTKVHIYLGNRSAVEETYKSGMFECWWNCQAMITERISRVRCVLARDRRYLLAQHNNRLPESIGKWGLVGGVLDNGEQPTKGLRRELDEEFRIGVGDLVLLGDWEYRDEKHRVFGCEFESQIEFYDRNEILDIVWLTYDGMVGFAEADLLHTGFELAAIREFRRAGFRN